MSLSKKWGWLIGALAFVLYLSTFTVNQAEQVIITQFGRPVGDPITSCYVPQYSRRFVPPYLR